MAHITSHTITSPCLNVLYCTVLIERRPGPARSLLYWEVAAVMLVFYETTVKCRDLPFVIIFFIGRRSMHSLAKVQSRSVRQEEANKYVRVAEEEKKVSLFSIRNSCSWRFIRAEHEVSVCPFPLYMNATTRRCNAPLIRISVSCRQYLDLCSVGSYLISSVHRVRSF